MKSKFTDKRLRETCGGSLRVQGGGIHAISYTKICTSDTEYTNSILPSSDLKRPLRMRRRGPQLDLAFHFRS